MNREEEGGGNQKNRDNKRVIGLQSHIKPN